MTEMSPPLEDPQAFVGWLRSLDDDGLVDYRYSLYDRAEVAPNAEGLRAACKMVCAVEHERRRLRVLQGVVLEMCPDVDCDAFESAMRSGLETAADPFAVPFAELFHGALAFGAAIRELENPRPLGGPDDQK